MSDQFGRRFTYYFQQINRLGYYSTKDIKKKFSALSVLKLCGFYNVRFFALFIHAPGRNRGVDDLFARNGTFFATFTYCIPCRVYGDVLVPFTR